MADRRHVARLAAKDVEHADSVFARGHVGQRTGTDEILEIAYTLLVHDTLLMRGAKLQAAWLDAMPSRAATCSRPPDFIHASTFFACSTTSLMSESKPKNRYGSPSASSVSRIA